MDRPRNLYEQKLIESCGATRPQNNPRLPEQLPGCPVLLLLFLKQNSVPNTTASAVGAVRVFWRPAINFTRTLLNLGLILGLGTSYNLSSVFIDIIGHTEPNLYDPNSSGVVYMYMGLSLY